MVSCRRGCRRPWPPPSLSFTRTRTAVGVSAVTGSEKACEPQLERRWSKGAPLGAGAKWPCFADRRPACLCAMAMAAEKRSQWPCARSLPLPHVSFRRLLRTQELQGLCSALLARTKPQAGQTRVRRRQWLAMASTPPCVSPPARCSSAASDWSTLAPQISDAANFECAGFAPHHRRPRFSLAVEWSSGRSWTVHPLNGGGVGSKAAQISLTMGSFLVLLHRYFTRSIVLC